MADERPLPARKLARIPRRPGEHGAPKIDWARHQDEIIGLGKIQCTTREAALCLGVAEEVFIRALSDNLWLRNLWDRARAEGLQSLRRKQLEMVYEKESVPMAIWLGKQYLGQREPQQDHSFVVRQLSDEQLEELTRRHLADTAQAQIVEAVFPDEDSSD